MKSNKTCSTLFCLLYSNFLGIVWKLKVMMKETSNLISFYCDQEYVNAKYKVKNISKTLSAIPMSKCLHFTFQRNYMGLPFYIKIYCYSQHNCWESLDREFRCYVRISCTVHLGNFHWTVHLLQFFGHIFKDRFQIFAMTTPRCIKLKKKSNWTKWYTRETFGDL